MRKTGLALAASMLLGLAACTRTAVTQSGGSGMEEGSYSYSSGADDCLPDDTNCHFLYNSPGGG